MNSWPRMSPRFMVGMKPSSRCRSDPQIAVSVTLTIASRGFRIRGSGTREMRTSFVPYQQSAFTPARSAPRLTCRRGDLARLELLLEAAQILTDLGSGVAAEELRERRAYLAPWRAVLQVHGDARAASRSLVIEVDRSGADDIGAFEGAPAEDLVRYLVDDLAVPLDHRAAWPLRPPMRDGVGDAIDRLEVAHELRQVLEVAPEAIELVDGAVERDALEHVEAARSAQDAARVAGRPGRVQADGFVDVAVRGHAAAQEQPADTGVEPAGARLEPRQPI